MGNELPEYFKCPISLEIMVDPVILSSGHTFDRTSIQRWLDSGHRTCPITKLPLPNHPPLLIPNHALRSLISNYAPPHHRLSTIGSEANSISQLAPLIEALVSKSSTEVEKVESITRLLAVSKAHPGEFRARATDSGGLSAVLRCIGPECGPDLQEKSLSLLLNLSLDSDDNKVGLMAEGVMEKLTAALVGPNAATAATAATLITSLATLEVNKAAIGAHPGAIRRLVTLMGGGRREKKEAATALFALCSFPENRRRAVDCGAVRVSLWMAKSGAERAVEVMGMLAKCTRGREELVSCCEEVVGVLVWFVKNGSSRGVQYGLMTLNLICCCSERVKVEVRRFGVLEMCFGFMEEHYSNEKIIKVASNLAKVLQEN